MGWVVLIVLGVLLIVQLVVFVSIRARGSAPVKVPGALHTPESSDDSALGF